jgi:hypothetical protein
VARSSEDSDLSTDAPAATPLQEQTPQQGRETPQHALHARIHGQTATRMRKIPRHYYVFESPPAKAALLFSLTAPHKRFCLPRSLHFPKFRATKIPHGASICLTFSSCAPVWSLFIAQKNAPTRDLGLDTRCHAANQRQLHTPTKAAGQVKTPTEALICRIDMLATPIVGKGADQESPVSRANDSLKM